MFDAELATVFVNPRMAAMLGYDVEEMYMRSFATLGMDVGEGLGRVNRAIIGDLEPERHTGLLLQAGFIRSRSAQRSATTAPEHRSTPPVHVAKSSAF